MIFPMVRPKPTPRCGDLLRSRVALNPSQVIQRSNLSATVFFLISISFMRNLHKLECLTPYTSDQYHNRSKGGVRTGTQEHNRNNNIHISEEKNARTRTT
jgi:hypothetical protein